MMDNGQERRRARAWVGRVLNGRAWWSWLRGGSAERVGAAAPAGLIRASALDAAFRQVCAVYGDGRCLIAKGYETDPGLRAKLLELRRRGVIPSHLAEESVALERIAAVWGEAVAVPSERRTQATVARLKQLFAEAAAARASDIMFEHTPTQCRVYAIVNDRRLAVGEPMPGDEGKDLMRFVFAARAEGSAQAGYLNGEFQGCSIRAGGAVPLPAGVSGLRCQRGPHEPEGDHMFLRLFYSEQMKAGATLEELGFSPDEAAVFAAIRMSLQGGIFLGGRTGDGKTTTLATNLSLQMAETGGQLNVVTLEDPVEYVIAGTTQIAVPTKGTGEERARHYQEALMHFCRIHPASGMVSEIRDGDAARQVLQFVDTGHQVWTTIHVDSANSIPFRLMDLGVSESEVCKPGSIKLLAKQALLPMLCGECALERAQGQAPSPGVLARLRGMERVRYRNPAGCGACRRGDDASIQGRAWNGYVGQKVVAELIEPDVGYLKCVRERDVIGGQAYWEQVLGGVPLGVKVWGLVGAGQVDPRDALRKGAGAPPDDRPFRVIEGGGSP